MRSLSHTVGIHLISLKKITILFSKMVMPSANSPININVVIVLHPQQQFISYVFYLFDNFSHFSRFVISYYGFNLNFSVIKNVEHSFMCLFVNCISSFLKSLCKSFTDFLLCCLFSYYWAVRFLFYFVSNHLPHLTFVNVFYVIG